MKTNSKRRIIFFIACFCATNLTLSQQSIIIQPGPAEGKDAKVWSLDPNGNYATHEFIKANAWTWGGEFGIERTYIEFDLSVVPENAEISAAYLTMYYHFLPGNPEQTHSGDNWTTLKRVTSDWLENTITWANQPGTTEQNKVIIPPTTGPQVDFTDIDVTQLVVDMLTYPENSFGFQFKIMNEETYRRVGLSTSDHPNSSRWPKLEIIFTCYIDLGNDTTLCDGDTLCLNAGSGYDQYLWSTDSIDSLICVTTTGQYWVTVHDGNDCEASDTINVDFIPDMLSQLDLGSDTTLCNGQELQLYAGDGFETYLWQDGSTEPQFLVQNPGLYWVSVTSDCGTITDSVYIGYFPQINLELGNDTILCEGENLILDAGQGFIEYSWSDGSSGNQYLVTEPGLYVVNVLDLNNCTASDEVNVSYHYVDLDLGNDTLICPGTFIDINAGQTHQGYFWNLPEYSGISSFSTDIPGTYWVQVTDSIQNKACLKSDTITIGMHEVPYLPGFLDEYTICQGDTLMLDAGIGDGFKYLWDDGSDDSVYYAFLPGQIKVWIYNDCDTVSKDMIITVNPLPEVNILLDSLTSEDFFFHLVLDHHFNNILWSNGSGENEIIVDNAGEYWVQVSNEFGCYASDTIIIEPVACDFKVPRVFTTNGDDQNPVFRISYPFIREFVLVVFDRWGNPVYESDNPFFEWDGTYNGQNCTDGVYYWIIKYNCTGIQGNYLVKKGSVTILR
jgi:gliding motility-associated-like protein